MNENNQEQGLQANPQLVINNLTNEVANLVRENAMLKAIIQEKNNNDSQESTQSE